MPVGRWLITGTGMVASFTMVLSGTIVNVAVPDVMGTFGVGQGLAQFLATAYLATMTASQLLGRWITGWLGRRVAFMVVLVVFGAGGLVCAASPTIDLLILGAGDAGLLGRHRPAVRARHHHQRLSPRAARDGDRDLHQRPRSRARFRPGRGRAHHRRVSDGVTSSWCRCRSSRRRWCSAPSSCRTKSTPHAGCDSTGPATHCCACRSSA